MKRFVDEGITWHTFSHLPISVQCPFCKKQAVVFQQKIAGEHHERPVFSCMHCCKSFDQSAQRENSLGYFSGVYLEIDEACACRQGKYKFHQYYPKRSFVPPFVQLQCSFCPAQKRIDPQSFQLRQASGGEINTDPYFGYRLYLTTAARNGLIFAYNPEQLSCLKAYISADLRQRTYLNANKAYFSRLPAWVKSARNRKEILKAILRLEQMAAKIQPST